MVVNSEPPAEESPRRAEPEYLTVTSGLPEIREIGMDAPPRWLRKGWADFRRVRSASVFYGIVLAVMGALLVNFSGEGAVGLALMTGFLIIGPFLLMGLYDLSRRLERGEAPQLGPTMTAWQANGPAIGFLALIYALLLAVWVRVSIVVVALFFPEGAPTVETIAKSLASSEEALVFIAAYGAAGLGFALFVFATAVVSLPMLLDREKMDTLSAMITSFNALRNNFKPMLLWAAIIVALTAVGFATYYLGLILTLPLVGHATWHAYREVVGEVKTVGPG